MCSGFAVSKLGEIGVREFARDSACHLTVSMRSHAKDCTLLKLRDPCLQETCLASRSDTECGMFVPLPLPCCSRVHGVASGTESSRKSEGCA